MLKFVFNDINSKKVVAFSPLAMTMNIEENVPADLLVAVFEYFQCDELCDICVFDDDTQVFKGIIDEQQCIASENGMFLKIVARSMAALLLDNESLPISYNQPDVEVIMANHLSPFGITEYIGDDLTCYGTLTAFKGMSNWQVVESFSKNTTGNIPRINALGQLDLSGISHDKTTVFGKKDGEVVYTAFSKNIKRCEEISSVNIKVTNSSGYHNKVTNQNATDRNIQRERYVNAVLTDTPVICADNMIKNGRKKGCIITLECPLRLLDVLGNKAVIKDTVFGDITGFYISSISYRLSENKECTTLILKQEEA